MQKRDLETLCAAGQIDRANTTMTESGWVLSFDGVPERFDSTLSTARGEVRYFASLDTLHGFIRGLPMGGSIRLLVE